MTIASFEIDGWGRCGDAIAVTDADNVGATVVFTGDYSALAGWEGARVRVWGVAGMTEGLYLLTQADASTATVEWSGGAVSASAGYVALEERYHVCDGVPAWVTGEHAAAMWLQWLVDTEQVPAITISAGQRVPHTGGMATIDGFDVRVSIEGRDRLGSLLYQSSAALYANLAYDATTASVWPVSLDQTLPVWIGSEAVWCSAASSSGSSGGVPIYSCTLRRGVLGSRAQSHLVGAWAVIGDRSPLGLTCRVALYEDDDTDPDVVGVGLVERASVDDVGILRLSVASHILGVEGKLKAMRRDRVVWRMTETGDETTPYEWQMYPQPRVGRGWWGARVSGFAVVADFTAGDSAERYVLVDENERMVRLDAVPAEEAIADVGQFLFVSPSLTPDKPWITWARAIEQRIADGRGGTTLRITFEDGGEREPIEVIGPVNEARAYNELTRDWVLPVGSRSVHPVEAIRQIVQSTGTGANGDYDTLPFEVGFGLSDEQVDGASFDAAIAADPVLTATNVWVSGYEPAKVGELLDALLKTYFYALASGTDGRLRIVDMARVTSPAPSSLSESDLTAEGLTPTRIAYTMTAAGALSSVSVKSTFASAGADSETRKITLGADSPQSFGALVGDALSVEPPFAVWIRDAERAAWQARAVSLLRLNAGLVGLLDVHVTPAWTGDMGDTAEINIDALQPFTAGGTAGFGVGRVVSRQRMVRPSGGFVYDNLSVLVYGAEVLSSDNALWAPFGQVDSVAADDEFDLVYPYGDEVTQFIVGDRVALFSSVFTRRDTGGAEIADITGDTYTLTAAWDVTPEPGDFVTLDVQSEQSGVTLTQWAYLADEWPGEAWR